MIRRSIMYNLSIIVQYTFVHMSRSTWNMLKRITVEMSVFTMDMGQPIEEGRTMPSTYACARARATRA